MHIRTYTSTMNIWNEGLLMHHCFSMRTVNSHKNTFSGFLGKCVYSTPCKKDVIYPTKRLPNPPNSKPINILRNPKTLSFVIRTYIYVESSIWWYLYLTIFGKNCDTLLGFAYRVKEKLWAHSYSLLLLHPFFTAQRVILHRNIQQQCTFVRY